MEATVSNLPLICTLVGIAGVLFAIILAAIAKKHLLEMRRWVEFRMQLKKALLPI